MLIIKYLSCKVKGYRKYLYLLLKNKTTKILSNEEADCRSHSDVFKNER